MARPATNHEAKKARIIEIALKVFAKYGFTGTTFKLIAQEAKNMDGESISPPLIYHYFPEGKTQLFIECLWQLPPIQNFERVLKSNTHEPPENFVRIVAQTYNEFLKTPEVLPIMRLSVMEGQNQGLLINTILGQVIPNLMIPFLHYFEEQVTSGKIRPMKFDQLLMQIVGPLLARRIAMSALPLDVLPIKFSTDEEFIESLVQTLLGGILRMD